MRVTISNGGHGGLTVHRHGCRDLAREYAEVRWSVNAETKRDVVLAIYDPGDFQFDPDTQWQNYADDVNFKPCVKLAADEV